MNQFLQGMHPFQKRLLTSAIALLSAVIILTVLFGVFLLLRAFTATFSTVLWPLATAGILALILRPVVRWIETRVKLSRTQSIAILYLLVATVLTGILALVLPVLFDQTVSFAKRLPGIWANLRGAFTERFPAVMELITEYIGEERMLRYQEALTSQLDELTSLILPATKDLFQRISGIIGLATGLAIVPVYLFFFLQSNRDLSADIKEQLSFVKEEWRDDLVFLIHEFAESMVAFFRGQMLICMVMGILFAIGFTISGVNFGIGLGLLIGATNLIPYLGTIIGLSTVLPIAYFQPDGGWVTLLMALSVFGIVQVLEGYVLTPKIMGKQTGLHPLTIIIAIFFWGVALGGLLGMILAIPLTAFFVVVWRLAKQKYLQRFTSADEQPDADSADRPAIPKRRKAAKPA
ncbi:MAG: AI-2E family transporter [Opitutales bacterium]|nr:AI-2E family transporter [Opitutales bacterium]